MKARQNILMKAFMLLTSKLSIKHYLIILWLIPLLLMGVFFGFYIVSQYINDYKKSINQNQIKTLSYLSRMSEYSLFAGDRESLDQLIKSFEIKDDIVSITILNRDLEILASSQSGKKVTSEYYFMFSLDPYELVNYNNKLFRFAKVYSKGMDVEQDFSYPFSNRPAKLLGYVIMEISHGFISQKTDTIKYTAALFFTFCLLFISIISYLFGDYINRYISSINNAIETLGQDRYEVHFPQNYPEYFRKLTNSIELLAKKLSSYQNEMDLKVYTVTDKMREALKELEKKNIELNQQKRVADQANKSKDEFLAKMSHELKTPVNSIIGFADLLHQSITNKNHKHHIEIIQNSAFLLLSLIDDLLGLSRIELKKIQLNLSDFYLDELIEQIVSMHENSARDKELSLEVSIDKNVPRQLIGDRIKLMQILNNIISNSIKFTDSGSINIEIGLINKSSEAYRIKFTVHDTGIGIKEEDRGMIFESFTQISSSKHTAFGAGIGLYIVKKLVDYLNGEITLDSVPGKGTSMSVILDFSNATSLNTATPTSSYILKTPHDEDRKESFENILKGKTILIAEDHDFSRLLLIEILKKYGAFTVEAKNGKELLEIFSASSPDLLLIDVHMPEMDGVETCKVIRADKSYDPDIPVILMTADTFLMKTINIIEIGANNIIFKPILEKDLIQVICQCMQLVSGGMVDLIYTTADSVRLDNINNNKLLEEFMILLENISIGAKISDVSMQRDNIHKLKGIAGLAEDDAFYSEVIVLSNYFKKGSHPQYEECINRLKQMVRKKQEEF